MKELEAKLDAHNQELRSAAADLAAANDRHTRDLEAAARVQRTILPVLPPEIPGTRFAWAFEPCSQLAGDYLNVFRLVDRHAGLCVLDMSGQWRNRGAVWHHAVQYWCLMMTHGV